jgi:hypothetical protein
LGRLTNGFNMAANEKSHYLPSRAQLDPEGLEIYAETIEQNVTSVTEERDVGGLY